MRRFSDIVLGIYQFAGLRESVIKSINLANKHNRVSFMSVAIHEQLRPGRDVLQLISGGTETAHFKQNGHMT